MLLLVAVALSACTGGNNVAESVPDLDSFTWSELSEADQLAVNQQIAELRSSNPLLADIETPEVIRVIPAAEWTQTFADCVNEFGFSVTVLSDGGVKQEADGSQIESLQVANFMCHAMYPMRPDQSGDLTEEQLKRSYEYQTVTLPACLAELGHEVTNAPSYETWKVTQTWSELDALFSSFMSSTGDYYYQVQESCPRNTPPEVLYVKAAQN